jgi:predicted house-cleaning noncanonical NTP pyrophosphatase (MazG superfamily)
LEELADLLEVMEAVVAARGYAWEQLQEIKEEKKTARGGFAEKILLLEVSE